MISSIVRNKSDATLKRRYILPTVVDFSFVVTTLIYDLDVGLYVPNRLAGFSSAFTLKFLYYRNAITEYYMFSNSQTFCMQQKFMKS